MCCEGDGECCCCYHPCACWKVIIYLVIGVAALITMIVLIVCSFQWVEVGFYGLDANYIVQIVDDKNTYDEGRYFLGLGHGFIQYPKTVQTLDFSQNTSGTAITARTKDGLALTLGITLQYELIRNSLPALYRMLDHDYVEVLKNVARDQARDVASHWRAVEFFHNRSSIEYDLRVSMAEAFLDFYARCTDVQMKSIDLPDAFETSIEQTEVARQDIEKAVFELSSAQVLAQTRIMYAQVDQTVQITAANASAQAKIVQAKASAQGLNLTTTATADAAATLAALSGFTPSDLVRYMYIQALAAHSSSALTIGLDPPVDLANI
eukprot:GAFH01002694.1.p1 GENE.GAFH01002694.1~~GAFH01002694.1.p1  ORF type:complete len:322 (-),score=94.68 GAFH01002694.1:95-1060(-)